MPRSTLITVVIKGQTALEIATNQIIIRQEIPTGLFSANYACTAWSKNKYMIKRLSYALVSSVALVLVLVLAVAGFSQTSPSNFPNIKISNFGQMDEHFY